MARARLRIICGNCGCNDLFSFRIDPKGRDYGDHFKSAVFIKCDNCGTIHSLDDSMSEVDAPGVN